MRKIYKQFLTLALSVVVFGGVGVMPAHASVYTGGASSKPSCSGNCGSGSGDSFNAKWDWLGPDLDHIRDPWGGREEWGGHPVMHANPNTPKNAIKAEMARKGILKTCTSPDVVAIFALTGHGRVKGHNVVQVRSYATHKLQARAGNKKYINLRSLLGQTYPNKEAVDKELGYYDWKLRKAHKDTHIEDSRTIICVTRDVTKFNTGHLSKVEYEPVSKKFEITCPYGTNVTVRRQITVDGKDPIGENNLHDQAGAEKKTAFGHKVDSLKKDEKKGKKPSVATAKKQLEAACKQSKASSNSVNLDAKNKAGLAEGGVLNVSEFSRNATYGVSEGWEKLKKCTIYEFHYKPGTNPKDPKNQIGLHAVGSCMNKQPKVKNHWTGPVTFKTTSAKITGFWQIISVHCNKEDFQKLVKETNGIQVQKTDDNNGKFTGVAYSKVYTKVPARMDFGDTRNAAGTAKRKSGTLGFYDKECPYDCTPASKTKQAGKNGANKNINNGTPSDGTKGKFGAVSENNNNKFEYFRDNEPRTITVDLWYPKNGNGVNYNGKKAITTTVNKWDRGTPSIDGSDGGKFTMKAQGKELFKGSSALKNQRNWDATPMNTKNSTILPGQYNSFTVQSTWPSEKNRPHVVNVKWEYAPNVATNFATNGLGFHNQQVGNHIEKTATRSGVKNSSAPIQGKCYAQFGTFDGINTESMFYKATGTGTKNTIDGKLAQGDTQKKPNDDSSNLFISFVRSTTE